MSRRLVIATRNVAKSREMSDILRALLGSEWRVQDLSAFAPFEEPDESADTYVGNAVIKAEAASSVIGERCIADDAGLEIDALGGQPGVHSKRFEGVASAFPEKISRILALLAEIPDNDRTARFRCAVAIAAPDLETRTFEATCEGAIRRSSHGKGGFGYDPIFVPSGGERTFAEMTADEKNAISHRGKVLRLVADWLRDRPN